MSLHDSARIPANNFVKWGCSDEGTVFQKVTLEENGKLSGLK